MSDMSKGSRPQARVGMEQVAKSTSETCQHYWLVEAPSGPTSMGRCKKCGKKQLHQNVFQTGRYWTQTIKNTTGKGHGLSKSQLDKRLAKEGRTTDQLQERKT